jgi:hypothetical protein
VNHYALFRTSGCESWCIILSQWLCIMVRYAEPVVVNHGVLFWASGCESWCVILSQWLWIMVWYAKDSGCDSWCIMVSKVVVNHDITTTGLALHHMTHNHSLSITHHDSQPLAQHSSTWLTTTCTALHTINHNHLLSITHHESRPLIQKNAPLFTTTDSYHS